MPDTLPNDRKGATLAPIVTPDVKAAVKRVLERHPNDPVLLMNGRALLWRLTGCSLPAKLPQGPPQGVETKRKPLGTGDQAIREAGAPNWRVFDQNPTNRTHHTENDK